MVHRNDMPRGVTMAGALWAAAEPNAFSLVFLTIDYPDPVRIKASGVGIGIRYLSVMV